MRYPSSRIFYHFLFTIITIKILTYYSNQFNLVQTFLLHIFRRLLIALLSIYATLLIYNETLVSFFMRYPGSRIYSIKLIILLQSLKCFIYIINFIAYPPVTVYAFTIYYYFIQIKRDAAHLFSGISYFLDNSIYYFSLQFLRY